VNEKKPRGVHDTEQKEKFSVFRKSVFLPRFSVLPGGGQGTEFFRDGFVVPDDVDMGRQVEECFEAAIRLFLAEVGKLLLILPETVMADGLEEVFRFEAAAHGLAFRKKPWVGIFFG